MEPLILASGSLRRHEFIRLMGIPFSVMIPGIDENPVEGLSPREQAERLSLKKADGVIKLLKGRSPPWILGADTIISLDGEVLGKPLDRDHAKSMLLRYQNREHEVITALTLYNGQRKTFDTRSRISRVRFVSISLDEIEWYLNSGEWQGAAGAYRIKGLASCFISHIDGSYSSIVGLPIYDFYNMLRENGYTYGA